VAGRLSQNEEFSREINVRKFTIMAVALGLGSLAACNKSPQEQTADNIEANAENVADNIEANADNAADNLQANADNAADATREAGDNAADAVRDGADANNTTH
jgi:hypothetical protein